MSELDDEARRGALGQDAVFSVERALLYMQVAGYLLLALADPDDGGAAALDDDALVAAMTRALIAAKNTEVPQLAVQAPVAERVAVLNAVEQRLVEAQKYVVGLNSQAEDAVRQGQDAAGFRRKATDVQAYMSVLSEIKNLLMQS